MPDHLPQLEICAETLQACSAALAGGAHRIEICTALSEGGVTPSHGFIRAAIEIAQPLPVYVLLRPRAGNFVYSESEFRVMRHDLEHAATLGAAGFVAGILTAQSTVDEARMRDLVRLAAGKEFTFHRAFDHTRDLCQALEQIIAVGCSRLLTSGGKPRVAEGLHTITKLAAQAGNRIRIAAGGGVTAEIAMLLRRIANVDLHASLRPSSQDPLWNDFSCTTDISSLDVQELASVLSVCPQ